MGDAGEGLIDAEAKIQERIEELQANRAKVRSHTIENPEQFRKVESLRLARTQMARQLESVRNEGRRNQLISGIAEIDRDIALIQAGMQPFAGAPRH